MLHKYKFVIFSFFLTFPAFAAEADIPVIVTIVQCGSKENIAETCRKDDRCCVFLKQTSEQDQYTEFYNDSDFPALSGILKNNADVNRENIIARTNLE